MDNTIFEKLKAKPDMIATLLYAPHEYPSYNAFSDTKDNKGNKSEFVHLFVKSQAEFAERFSEASNAVADGGLFWVSYPKSDRKNKYDINRNSLWGLVIPLGWHPVGQISLSDEWSAVRLKRNEDGVVYECPGNVKK